MEMRQAERGAANPDFRVLILRRRLAYANATQAAGHSVSKPTRNTLMDWNDGYVADVEYLTGFFREQSPAFLNFACVLNGYEPIPLNKPFTYFELGSGQGLTANLLAASNPRGSFYATDFMPSHVAGARQLAARAGLENLTLLENSFAELAEGQVADLPQFDFITMYGVYTWVNTENRRHIVNFIARYLKPGGVVFLSYNALPGWNAALPLRRLMIEHAERNPNKSSAQVVQARELVEQLVAANAGYFKSTPGVQTCLDSLREDHPAYLAHEYMHRGWEPLYFADVARDLAAAKLDYVGSTNLMMAFPHFYLTPARQALLDAAPDIAMRETISDYLLNTPLREDVFVRGARAMSPLRKTEWLQQVGVALTVPRDTVTLDMKTAAGVPVCKPELYVPMLDALAKKPHTLSELAVLPDLDGKDVTNLAEVAAMLVMSEQAATYFPAFANVQPDAAYRMNRALAQQARYDDNYQVLASPLLGNGVMAGLVQRLVYLSLSGQPNHMDIDADAIIRDARQIMAAQGLRITPESEPMESEMAELSKTVKAILERRVPIWRQLMVL
jgi:SAM-dependent methyltransferase